MALTAGISPRRRGAPPTSGVFAYPVAPGEKIWRGGMVGINASYQLQRLQTSGTVGFVGMAARDYDNSASSAASPDAVEAMRGTFALTVPSAAASNMNANVYASDDGTLTLTASGNTLIGTLVGFEAGQTYVKLLG